MAVRTGVRKRAFCVPYNLHGGMWLPRETNVIDRQATLSSASLGVVLSDGGGPSKIDQ